MSLIRRSLPSRANVVSMSCMMMDGDYMEELRELPLTLTLRNLVSLRGKTTALSVGFNTPIPIIQDLGVMMNIHYRGHLEELSTYKLARLLKLTTESNLPRG